MEISKGKNEKIIEPDKLMKVEYPVVEIFNSIQGEGSYMGAMATFIRFKGCNLACPWCDSKETWNQSKDIAANANSYKMLTVQEILKSCNCKIVVLTGGEPCIQKLHPLIVALHLMHLYVCVETNGTLATDPDIDWVVASPKPPAYVITPGCKYNELKYVVDENFDTKYIPDSIKRKWGAIWLQPCDYGTSAEAAMQTRGSIQHCVQLVKDNPYCRVGIQMHKLLGVK